jgi:hypothetical protein
MGNKIKMVIIRRKRSLPYFENGTTLERQVRSSQEGRMLKTPGNGQHC